MLFVSAAIFIMALMRFPTKHNSATDFDSRTHHTPFFARACCKNERGEDKSLWSSRKLCHSDITRMAEYDFERIDRARRFS